MSRCPFETLGVEPRFDVDLHVVEENRRALARKLHPDKHVGSSAGERRLALNHSIDVNDAVRVLKDPIKRAEALFRRAGINLGDEKEPSPSPAFLMEMMEAREELADAARARDVEKVRALASPAEQDKARAVARLTDAFAPAAQLSREALLETALSALGELRYAQRFLDEIAAFEEAIDDDVERTAN